MRLAELPRTTSFRLAMLFLLLFGTAALLLCGFLYWQTKDFLAEREDETLVTEQAAFDGLDAPDLRELLAAHVVMDPHLERPLTLFGPVGERVAGSPVGSPVAGPAERSALHVYPAAQWSPRLLPRADPPPSGQALPARCPRHDEHPRLRQPGVGITACGAVWLPSCSA